MNLISTYPQSLIHEQKIKQKQKQLSGFSGELRCYSTADKERLSITYINEPHFYIALDFVDIL